MDYEMMPADASARKRAILIVVIAALWGIACFTIAMPFLQRIKSSDDPARDLQFLMMMLSAMFLPVIVFAGYLIVLGIRIFRSGKYPLPGSKLIRPMRLYTGMPAYRYGIGFILIAGVLIFAVMRMLFLLQGLMLFM